MKTHSILVFALACVLAFPAAAETPASLRRFALVAGSNTGGDGQTKLKFAESDARSVATVLGDLGGVRADDLVLILEPDLARFQEALARMRQKVAGPREGDERRELIVYYSGHSDEDGLILGKERFPYDALRQAINGITAEVKVAILDSCASGAMTRAKGGVTRPAFLFDASSDMTGHAYLTSSSEDEAAQESDRIGASFFTHFLVSGLRGAADTSGDGVVTLNEAYAFAFQETLASTEKTQYGAQHPAYDISLTGSGDLVLTDLRSTSAGLIVAEDVSGRMYVRDERGALAVELNKTEGQSVELALSPGTYSVVVDNRGNRSAADVRVTDRARARLALSSLRPVPADRTTARGDQPGAADGTQQLARVSPLDPAEALGAAVGAAVGSAVGKAVGTAVNAAIAAAAVAASAAAVSSSAEPEAPDAADPGIAPQVEPFRISFLPEFSEGILSSRTAHAVSINVLVGSSGSSNGFEVGGLGNIESRDVNGFQAAGLFNLVFGGLKGFQAAGLVNAVVGDVTFFQSAGLVNLAFGGVRGLQMAGLGNASVGAFDGAQIAGLANVALGDSRGAQVSGLINWAQEGLRGAQVAGIGNWGRQVSGPQISVVNVADTITGVQVGVVNIARKVGGVQVGVVNISREMDGVPIGLVSIVEQGRHALDLWWDSDGTANAALSLGTKSFYNVYCAGWVPESMPVLWAFGLGLGAHLAVGPVFGDIDLSVITERTGFTDWTSAWPESIHPRLRAVVGLPVLGNASLVAGVAVKMTFPDGAAAAPVFSPSFIAGIQF